MPIDMPPQAPATYVVAPAKAEAGSGIHAQVARFLGAERIRAEQKAGITIGSFDAARRLPPLDLKSPKLTQAERQGMAAVLEASQGGRLGTTGVSIPDGYIARRMGAAVLTARLADRSQAGHEVSAKAIDAVRCRLVAVVMDPRAADYVKGGEKAAAASRAELSRGDVERCAPSLAEQAARLSSQRTGIDPSASRSVSGTRTSISPVAQRIAAVSVSPRGSTPISIDPMPSKRVSVSPVASKRVSIDPVGSNRTASMPDFAKSRRVDLVHPASLEKDVELERRMRIAASVMRGEGGR